MINKNIIDLNWDKNFGIIPVIIQNYESGEILMLGYMNKIALSKTIKESIVTFFSRTKKKLWKKGEVSGNFLKVVDIFIDCDCDTILILVNPDGVTCHTGKYSCFNEKRVFFGANFLDKLERVLITRKKLDPKISYTSLLYKSGTKRIAQKVAEEGIETALAAAVQNKNELINESSDLIYHLLVLLNQQNICLKDVVDNLKKRYYKKSIK